MAIESGRKAQEETVSGQEWPCLRYALRCPFGEALAAQGSVDGGLQVGARFDTGGAWRSNLACQYRTNRPFHHVGRSEQYVTAIASEAGVLGYWPPM